MSDSNVNMKFVAQTADAQKRIAELEKEVASLNKESKASSSSSASASSGLSGMAAAAVPAAAAVAAVVAALKAGVNAAKECVAAYKEQELAETRLATINAATGRQLGLTTKDMKDLASATQEYSRFGDEAVLEAEQILMATQKLDKDGLQRALADTADLAEVMGTDISSAASTMAYALQDPEAGLSRLRRQGIAFSDEEEDLIKTLMAANNLYGAQEVLLQKIESKYQGVAKAVGDVPVSTLDKIKNTLGDIKEDLGQGIVNKLAPAFNWILQQLQKVHRWASDRLEEKEFYNKLEGSGTADELADNFSRDRMEAALEEYEGEYKEMLKNYSNTFWGKALASVKQSVVSVVNKSDSEITTILERAFETYFAGTDTDYSGLIEDAVNDVNEIFRPLIAAQQKLREAMAIQDNIADTAADYKPASGTTAEEPAVAAAVETQSQIEKFLQQNASSSRNYQAAQYQAIIDQAKEFRDLIRDYGGALNEDGESAILELLGLPEGTTINDVQNIATQLDEIIASTQEKKDNLFQVQEEPAEEGWLPTDYLKEYSETLDHLERQMAFLDQQIEGVTDPTTLAYLKDVRDGLKEDYDELKGISEDVRTINDYIEENTSLSATAQAAALDAKIAEAEMWRDAAEAGSNELTILEEIIARLREQRGELEETGETWKDQAKKILNEWSPVVSKFQGLTSAVTEFMTQMWDRQADRMEAALERDKKAGDMSEKEEEERLAQIDTLKRKSFEADKTNAIASALVNGALAVTQCLAEMGPVAGAIAAGIVATTTAIQVATIASQQYTPMAKGGIVTEATPIIAGEAGPEAIIPLSGGRAQQYLGNAGNVTINITIEGNADEDVVFHAIERAQRTGYLPKWSYA